MSIDALRLVSEYMTPAGRINLARINASTSKALAKWEDVHSVLFDETKIIMAGEVFRHQIDIEMDLGFQHSMNDVFRLCPHARRVWIQKRLQQEHLEALQQHANVIELLYISSENFDTQYPLSWEKMGFKRLRSVNVLHRMDQPLNLKQFLDKTACQALLPITLRHVCLTGIVLSSVVMDALVKLTNLRHLELMGSVIDTQMAAGYVEELAQMPNLDEFTMPPSMFSFSLKDERNAPLNMRKLHLSKLSIYMDCFEESTFFDVLETMMPKKLETLTLYGNYYQLKHSKKYGQFQKFEIIFGSMTPQIRTPWFIKDDSTLMSHLVRCAPYKIADDFRPIRSTATSWRFDQSVLETEDEQRERTHPVLTRFLRFAQPAPLAIAPAPRALAEPPPPPIRRERIRRRPNVPTVAEEPAIPVMLSLPPPGAVSAPVSIVIPPAPPLPRPAMQQQVVQQSDTTAQGAQSAGNLPAASLAPPVADAPTRIVHDPALHEATAPVVENLQPPASRANEQTSPVSTAPQSVHVQEVPENTPASADHPQPIVELPEELQPLNTQPASPPIEVEDRNVQRATAGAAHVENADNRNRPRERHPEDENVNMMLQGMLQALVEEIVFDAMNEEHTENARTDPPPAVSSDATASTRTTATTNSELLTLHGRQTSSSVTRTPATPPPTIEAGRQQLNQTNDQATRQ